MVQKRSNNDQFEMKKLLLAFLILFSISSFAQKSNKTTLVPKPFYSGMDNHTTRKSVIQLAELEYSNGKISRNRDKSLAIKLSPNQKQ